MKEKILCFDLDGTLLTPEGTIHPFDRENLLNAKDVHLIPATGRALNSIKRIFAKNNLFIDQPLPFPIVTQNGAVLFHANEKLFRHSIFDQQTQAELIHLILPVAKIVFLFFNQDEIYLYSLSPLGEEEMMKYRFSTKLFSTEYTDAPFSKIMCFGEPPELSNFASRLSNLPVEGFFSLANLYEIAPRGVNKDSGLRSLLEDAGIADPVIFFAGDGENDIQLIQSATRSFAPSNALPEILLTADRCIDREKEGLLEPMLRELRGYKS
jgi:5-amino-6-(5-phospho-D-ribitylamino)uracil phosphatase